MVKTTVTAMTEAVTQLNAELHAREVRRGERFTFGRNWARFLTTLSDERISRAENSLNVMLNVSSLEGQRFLDAGSGSGLFSLAARNLGATVHSFDFDPQSVACTEELKRRYYSGDLQWTIEQASVLDQSYLHRLGQFEVVYSWGVLHHTGAMWQALDNIHPLVAPGGQLVIAIYNDQGTRSLRWHRLKQIYNRLPGVCRVPYTVLVSAPQEVKSALRALISGQMKTYLQSWRVPSPRRGMNRWHDLVDWVGGYPYEFASPEAIFRFFRDRGFVLTELICGNAGLGCNEFVFQKHSSMEIHHRGSQRLNQI